MNGVISPEIPLLAQNAINKLQRAVENPLDTAFGLSVLGNLARQKILDITEPKDTDTKALVVTDEELVSPREQTQWENLFNLYIGPIIEPLILSQMVLNAQYWDVLEINENNAKSESDEILRQVPRELKVLDGFLLDKRDVMVVTSRIKVIREDQL